MQKTEKGTRCMCVQAAWHRGGDSVTCKGYYRGFFVGVCKKSRFEISHIYMCMHMYALSPLALPGRPVRYPTRSLPRSSGGDTRENKRTLIMQRPTRGPVHATGRARTFT